MKKAKEKQMPPKSEVKRMINSAAKRKEKEDMKNMDKKGKKK